MKKQLLVQRFIKTGFCLAGLCLPSVLYAQAPVNDNCPGAITLTVGTDPSACTPLAGSTLNATPSSILSDCSFAAKPDVWYAFTATHSVHNIKLTNISSIVPGLVSYTYTLALYEGACGTLVPVNCSQGYFYGGNASNVTLNASGLTPGAIYYIQVVPENAYNAAFSQVANTINFDLCVLPPPPPPANDNCINAIDISDGIMRTGYNVAATFSDIAPGSCAYWDMDGANDVWYKVTAPAAGPLEITNNVFNNEDMVLEILSGDCSAPVILECANNTFYFNTNNITMNAAAGETYLLRVYGYDGTNTTANFTIKAGGVVALPAKLSKLDGFAGNDQKAYLSWQTMSEQNNLGFEIQRSADGSHFYKAGYVPSAAPGGNSSTTLPYTFTDQELLSKTAYFRLKQTDYDGQTSFSETLQLHTVTMDPASITASPNPVTDKLTLHFSGKPEFLAELQVRDLAGKLVQTIPVSSPETIINMSDYAAGVYLLHFTDGNQSRVMKICKQ